MIDVNLLNLGNLVNYINDNKNCYGYINSLSFNGDIELITLNNEKIKTNVEHLYGIEVNNEFFEKNNFNKKFDSKASSYYNYDFYIYSINFNDYLISTEELLSNSINTHVCKINDIDECKVCVFEYKYIHELQNAIMLMSKKHIKFEI